MNNLIRKESDFLRLLMSTSAKQQKALLKSIELPQMKAIVQIVYNVLVGNRELKERVIKTLQKHKMIIRRLVSKSLSFEKRKTLLVKYFKYVLPFLQVIESEL